jgi:hypothetical protein
MYKRLKLWLLKNCLLTLRWFPDFAKPKDKSNLLFQKGHFIYAPFHIEETPMAYKL